MTDKPTLLLEHHLKELKLPSFLREYSKMATKKLSQKADELMGRGIRQGLE